MVAKGWDEGPDQEELLRVCNASGTVCILQDGTARRTEADLVKAKEASLSHGFSERDVRNWKRAKAMPIQAPAGRTIWQIDVIDRIKAPEIRACLVGDSAINSTV